MTLSVAMCTYNGARYVREQLESILQQELPVDEIVVCDDGSKDETLAIVRDIAGKHPEVQWNIQQNSTNLGVTKNFEKALTLCTGDILFLSDQDDLWRKDKTRVICNYFRQHPDKSVIFTDAELIDAAGKSLTKHSLLDSVLLLPNIRYWNAGMAMDILSVINRCTGATMAVRKSFLPQVLPFEVIQWCLHDEQLAVGACAYDALGLIEERLISYRQHGNNVVGVKNNNWIYTGEPCRDLFKEIRDPSYIKPVFLKYRSVSSHLRFYLLRKDIRLSLRGKLRLLFSLLTYFREYYRYAIPLWWYDLHLGITYALHLRK